MKNRVITILFSLICLFLSTSALAVDYQVILTSPSEGSILGNNNNTGGMACGVGAYGKNDDGNYSDDTDCNNTFSEGSELSFQAKAIDGYELDKFTLVNCSESLPSGIVTGDVLTFTVNGNCLVQATFKEASTTAIAVNGECGTADNKTYTVNASSYGSDTQCASGVVSDTSFPASGAATSWSCSGENDGTAASCSASREASVNILNNFNTCSEPIIDGGLYHLLIHKSASYCKIDLFFL